jgi:diadenosine tetraphosphate (Ap4A) HIT family hydrolase
MRLWPEDWEQRVAGEGCPVCAEGRPDESNGRVRVYRGDVLDAYLNRDDAAIGYTVAFWRGSHVTEATQLDATAAEAYWRELLRVCRGIERVFRPAKLNLLMLGNTVPHLHAHVVPRYLTDPDPGRPPRFMMGTGDWHRLDDDVYMAHVASLTDALSI